MTSYEIVKKNITFQDPDRIAYKFPALAESDITRLFLQWPRAERFDGYIADMTKKTAVPDGDTDEWGVTWRNLEGALGLGQPIDHPIKDLDDWESYVFPDPLDSGRFDGLEQVLKKAEKEAKWVQLNSQYCMFERLHLLLGYEDTLIGFYSNLEAIEGLCDKALDFQISILHQAHKLSGGRIHCFETSDDWGTQNNLTINPALWKQIFKPRYKRLVDEVHALGMYFELHSCGYISDIMDDLIDIGVDMVNIHQPNLMDIKEFGKKYAGKIAFDVAVDIQQTLPSGDKALIAQEVKDLIEYWGTSHGGIIAAEYRFLESIGATVESALYAFECFKEYGNLSEKRAGTS